MPLTVKQLIEALGGCDPDATVKVEVRSDWQTDGGTWMSDWGETTVRSVDAFGQRVVLETDK